MNWELSLEGGWAPEGETPPVWHFFAPGTERALCGEVWTAYGMGRPVFERGGAHEQKHPAHCLSCELRSEKWRKKTTT